MTYEKILSILSEWQSRMQECELRMGQFEDLFSPIVEGKFGNAVYNVMDGYTALVSESIGWDVGTLADWWLEHNFGERPMRIGFPGEKLRSISTVEELAEFIEEDLRRVAP